MNYYEAGMYQCQCLNVISRWVSVKLFSWIGSYSKSEDITLRQLGRKIVNEHPTVSEEDTSELRELHGAS